MADAPLVRTHTVAALPVSPDTFGEVARLLRRAGHDDVFTPVDGGILIDMTGFALVEGAAPAEGSTPAGRTPRCSR